MDSTHEEVKHKKSIVGSEENNHIGYGLRENPKKSWKFSGFKEDITSSAAASSMDQNQCKVCGKEFESLKALYGHMRHHSGGKRRRIQCKECEKWFLSLKSLSNHMGVHAQKLRFHNDHQSETTSSCSRHDLVVESLYAKKKRSKRIKRYRSINASSSDSSLNEPLLSFNETDDDQEVEQVAVCLMMLSKGVHDWGEFHSFNEFSDDDDPAVSFEVKSLIQKKRTLRHDDEPSEINKPRDACASDSLTDLNEQIEKNDDQLEVCTEKLHKGSEFGMPKLDIESGFVSYGIEIEKEIEVELERLELILVTK
ncbi:zinc finger protein CG2199-like [Mangifera indica]|uniref:zinc finger protein CG2199-like n=1 Tax=Mangifera indica TaxID=29780 RepID=UPI001CF97AF7|nr:zinc finger protein CG2199-like [Mangifera indica]